MPGNYTITSRADGLVLTAAIYNADHQNHVDNQTPAGTDDYSVNLTQMLLTTDPGETGSESLASSLAGEIERLRFSIAEIKGVLWHVTNTLRNTITALSSGTDDSAVWLATGSTSWRFRLRIPDGWSAASNLTFKFLRHVNGVSGTAKMNWQFIRNRDGAAPSTITGVTAIDFTPVDTNSHLVSLTLTGATLAAGDIIVVVIDRNGDDAGDTETNQVFLDGHWVEYTGIAGR